jgi:hypothetical protein
MEGSVYPSPFSMTQFTRIFWGANSSASFLVNALTPPLAVEEPLHGEAAIYAFGVVD